MSNIFALPPTSALQHELSREALRDYFAGQMAPAIYRYWVRHEPDTSPGFIAGSAYLIADAMLAERGK